MKITRTDLSDDVLCQLIVLSKTWEQEGNVYGYRANSREDIEGNEIFIATEDDKIIGYLFGHMVRSDSMTSVIPAGSKCFEVCEVYVKQEHRSKGIGKKLFKALEDEIDYQYLTLSEANRNYKPILHFYIDEIGMNLHSARLYKKRNGAD